MNSNGKSACAIVVFALLSGFASAQDVKVISMDEFQKLLTRPERKVRVVNFWATWCKPCVDEMPYFVKAAEEMKPEQVEFIFASVDFQSYHDEVESTVKELGMKGLQFHLNTSGNAWIDEVDKSWSGAIPFTLMILPNGRRFTHADQFENYEDLKSFLNHSNTN